MGRSDEQAIKAAVEQFLGAVSSYDLDAVEKMVVSNANVGWASLRDGKSAWCFTVGRPQVHVWRFTSKAMDSYIAGTDS
jgi:hypothetical protein